jgi:hypothetical protein
MEENFELITLQWKKDIKDEILKEVKIEIEGNFEKKMKKEHNPKLEMPLSDEDIMDISRHSQKKNQ